MIQHEPVMTRKTINTPNASEKVGGGFLLFDTGGAIVEHPYVTVHYRAPIR